MTRFLLLLLRPTNTAGDETRNRSSANLSAGWATGYAALN
jgi:hypothetical protein